ncbi:PREDICTED: leucine-rich repeat and immunoglobulin-like domain-containing nogo receptor-interacting protein 2 [Branchiostoma belcheri]|uniref:Leucine-rich repeat and immunoglobulin-like domain-containing nogo receptor-interacting protein 2 n=1 Tax=Branchiostoma belcheri TaxID=7741 RepID=A0A6P4YTH9_BRABE|nr:PREDICTED: leucine-rich repeat and immunoglobulin-like domain-containing nogo receptor-interacting protein 2 [Branchiostoma belcheri]
MVTLPSTAYYKLLAIRGVDVSNNPWQCDCRMRPFRLKMTGSGSFENQMICFQPDSLKGQRLKHVHPEDLKCREPTIVSFQRGDRNTLAQKLTLRLVCQVSGTPSPDVTVTLPSGLNVTAESGGRMTVQVNGTTSTITITNATSADAGLYICTAANHGGSAFATLFVDVQLNTPTATANTKTPPLSAVPD